jgi:hypothetical protein
VKQAEPSPSQDSSRGSDTAGPRTTAGQAYGSVFLWKTQQSNASSASPTGHGAARRFGRAMEDDAHRQTRGGGSGRAQGEGVGVVEGVR